MTAVPVPETAEDVTADWLTAALQQRWPDIEVGAIRNATPIGEGSGQMSVLRRLTLDHACADAPKQMVLKLHTPHPDMRSVAERYRMFEREVNFY